MSIVSWLKGSAGSLVQTDVTTADPLPVSASFPSNATTTTTGTGINVAATPSYHNDTFNADVPAAVAATAGLRLLGWSVAETAGAVASFRLIHGATTGGARIARENLPANGSSGAWFGPEGIACPNGITLGRISGAMEIDLYTKVVA